MPNKILTKIELQECVCNGEMLSFIEFAWLKSYEVVAIVMVGGTEVIVSMTTVMVKCRASQAVCAI